MTDLLDEQTYIDRRVASLKTPDKISGHWVAWHASYAIEASLALGNADAAVGFINPILAARSCEVNELDKLVSPPRVRSAWLTERYSPGVPRCHLVHSGKIIWCLGRAMALAPAATMHLAEPAIRSLDEWDDDWDGNAGLYRETDKKLVAPLNVNVAMADALLEVGSVLGIQRYIDRADQICEALGKLFAVLNDGGYCWPYSTLRGREVDTIPYAAMMFRLAGHLLDHGHGLFGNRVIRGFGIALRRCQSLAGHTYSLDGKGKPRAGYETGLVYGAGPLARHAPYLGYAARADFHDPMLPPGPASMTAVGLAELQEPT